MPRRLIPSREPASCRQSAERRGEPGVFPLLAAAVIPEGNLLFLQPATNPGSSPAPRRGRNTLATPIQCHPERSEGSTVVSRNLKVALLPDRAPLTRNPEWADFRGRVPC
jgi:hypothetical protein